MRKACVYSVTLACLLGISLNLNIHVNAQENKSESVWDVLRQTLTETQTQKPSSSIPKGKPASIQEMLQGEHAPDRLIVKFKASAAEDTKLDILQKINLKRLRRLPITRMELIALPPGQTLAQSLAALKNNPNVEYAEPDYIVHTSQQAFSNDPYALNLWGLNNIGQSGGVANADIDLPEAWASYRPSVMLIVAVIDTGIDYSHPDLISQMWINTAEDINRDGKYTTADHNGKDEDGNGYIDDVVGWDFANKDNDPMDDNNHGIGVAGVGGRGGVKVMALKFLRADGSGYTSDAISALAYAGNKRAFIANNSWGGGSYSQALYDAIYAYRQKSGLFIAAAGNNGVDADSSPSYPAAYNLDSIISVASITNTDAMSGFSNFGATSVDIAAPGSSIVSTLPGNRYGAMNGTSMAAPHVSGVAALVWSQRPTIGLLKIKSILMGSARKTPALQGKTVSGGVVNANSALKAP
jgi:large repetitive protein